MEPRDELRGARGVARALVGLVCGTAMCFTPPSTLADASAGPPQSSLDVPLTVHEVAGVDRRQDVCSTGVPLPCGLLREPEGIALFDSSGKAVPAQFRVLERWRDLSFRISPSPISAAEAESQSRALDYPLLAHPPADWCYAAGALSPTPEHAREKGFLGGAVKAHIGTGRNWVNFGGDVTDQIRRRYHGADLGGFARTGDPAQAHHLYNMGRHSSGMTPLWLDDYQYPRDVKKLTHAQYCGLAREAGKYRPGTWHHGYMTWNDAHFCCQEVFDNWRLFGDPLALDALTTIGRWCQAYVDFREAHPDQLIAGTRADGLPLHNLCEAYRILGDDSMRKSLERFAEVCWKQVHKERGNYGVMDSWEGGKDQCEKPFMMARVIKGLRSYWELTGSERTADQIYGMADFVLKESSLGVALIDPATDKPAIRLASDAAQVDRLYRLTDVTVK